MIRGLASVFQAEVFTVLMGSNNMLASDVSGKEVFMRFYFSLCCILTFILDIFKKRVEYVLRRVYVHNKENKPMWCVCSGLFYAL